MYHVVCMFVFAAFGVTEVTVGLKPDLDDQLASFGALRMLFQSSDL